MTRYVKIREGTIEVADDGSGVLRRDASLIRLSAVEVTSRIARDRRERRLQYASIVLFVVVVLAGKVIHAKWAYGDAGCAVKECRVVIEQRP